MRSRAMKRDLDRKYWQRLINRLLMLECGLMYVSDRASRCVYLTVWSMLGAQRPAPSTPEVAQRHVQNGSRPMKCVEKKSSDSYAGEKGRIERNACTCDVC